MLFGQLCFQQKSHYSIIIRTRNDLTISSICCLYHHSTIYRISSIIISSLSPAYIFISQSTRLLFYLFYSSFVCVSVLLLSTRFITNPVISPLPAVFRGGGNKRPLSSGVQRSCEVMPDLPRNRLVKQGSRESNDGSVSSEGSK